MAGIQALPYPRQRRHIGPTTIGGIALVVIIIGALAYTGVLAQARQYLPGATPPAPVYQSSTVSKGNLSVTVTATGPISAVSVLPLSFKQSGLLDSLKASVGDQVTKGQVLATLDTTDLTSALDQAKANLAVQQANLLKVQSGATSAARDVAQTSVDSATSSAADAAKGIDTAKATSDKSVQSSQASVASAQTSLASANSALASTRDQETKSLASDQLAIDNAQKNLDAVQANVTANGPVLLLAVAKAKNDLYTAQTSRDATCSHPGSNCASANASVASAQTGLDSANAQLIANQKTAQQQISTAQASLDSARAAMVNDKAKLDASVISAQNAVKQANAALTSAQAAVGQAEAQAAASVESARNSADQAANAAKAAQASYSQTVAPPTQADLDSAKAQVANAQVAVDVAQLNLESATLVAPFDGTIAAVNGSVGQWISGGTVASTTGSVASATAIFTLMSLNNLQVVAQVNEADISKVQLGNPVTFNVSAFPDKTFTGKVLAIQPVGTTVSNVVNYNVTSSIQSDKTTQLYPGMTATVTVVTAEHDGVMMVPNTAITFAQSAFQQGLLGGNRRGNGTPGPGQGQRQGQGAVAGTPAAGRATTDGTPVDGQGAANGTPAAGQGQGQRPANGTPGPNGGQRQGNGNGGGGNGGGRGNFSAIVTLVNGQLTPKRVVLGLTDGTNTEIVSGLTGNESVVVGPIGRTTSGTTAANGQRAPGGGAAGPGLFIGGGRGGD